MCVYTVPLTLLPPGIAKVWPTQLGPGNKRAEQHVRLHPVPVPTWKQTLHKAVGHHFPSAACAALTWNEVDKGPQLPDSLDSRDTPRASLQKHTPCKNCSTKMIHSHRRHPARSVTVQWHFLRSRTYSWFKETVS